jgi:hypothetical protein
MDRRGPLSKHGPRYLRWGLMEAAIHASAHPLYKERYQRTKRRLLTCAAAASPDNTWSSKSDEAIETWAQLHTITNPPAGHRAAHPAGLSPPSVPSGDTL